ncbi:uncharacterized protein LOC108864720 [Galendromus occidentalis]|uniref:Uncharacterized protein LOC108864720 n=1 Tax=Galendromus occidentalis TaxID=34638 RepID=A0AAJ7SGJ4_9ACAR|nr:uncharacterized protein LOC108864720 [Galendromus occidentalis]
MNEVQNEIRPEKKELSETENKMPSATVVNILDEALREISEDRVEDLETKTQTDIVTESLPSAVLESVTAAPLRVEVPLPSTTSINSTAASVAPSNVTVTTMPAQVFSGSQVTSVSGPVLATPIMVTGVVIPRAPLPSNLISFVDASGNMQLAAVASPVLNPIHIRPPGVVVNAGNSTPSPIVVNSQPSPSPCAAPLPQTAADRPRCLSAIVPALPSVQPPIFKSTVRTIQPNKIVIKNITPPLKAEKETVIPPQETPAPTSNLVQSSQPVVTTLKQNAEAKAVVESITIESKQLPPQPETSESPARPPVDLGAGIKLEGEIKSVESVNRSEDEDKVNDVKYKILSVSTSQGISKADELARTNLFKLVESESNVVITAPSTAVQDILDQLKKQFPDKKFVINYNSSKTASANLKNLVQGVKDGVAAAERALKRADADNSVGPPSQSAKRRKTSAKKAQVEAPPAKNPVNYRSARLRGEKAPDLFEGGSRKPKHEPKSTSSPTKSGSNPPRARGRPRKVRVEASEDSTTQQKNASQCLPRNQDAVMLGEEDSTASSGTSSGQSNEYNAEIRVGDEYQAVLTEFSRSPPPDDYDEKADLIYHPEQGLLKPNHEGNAKADGLPLYDFVEWSHQEKRIFKKYLGGYKTKFFKYLSVLPNKRLLDVIDHYYSTHSPARDYVLPKKSKHYYLVSKNKQIVAPKGVFGIINEKRKVVPNRKFSANSNIVLYDEALPTRKPRESATRKEKAISNGKLSKIVKFEDVMKPMPNSSSQKTKKKVVSSVSSAENSENESELSTEEDALSYGMKKQRPGTDFGDDVKELISKESVSEIETLDEDLEKLKDELTSMKNAYNRNKAEAVQMEAEMKKIAKSVDSVNKAIGKARKITETWSEEDRLLTIQAFKTYGKDFKAVSRLVGTKNEQAIKYFYDTNAQRYGLDTPIASSSKEAAVVAAQPPASPSKPTAPDSPARGPRPMPSILRRKIAMKPLKS